MPGIQHSLYRHDLSGRSRIACPDDSKNLQLSRQYMSDNFSQLVKSNPDRLPCLRLIPDSFIIGSLLFELVGLLRIPRSRSVTCESLPESFSKKLPAGCSGAASESVACASASEADVSFGSVDCDSTSGILVVAEPRGSADCGSDASATVCVAVRQSYRQQARSRPAFLRPQTAFSLRPHPAHSYPRRRRLHLPLHPPRMPLFSFSQIVLFSDKLKFPPLGLPKAVLFHM